MDGMLFVKECIAVSHFSPQIEALTHTMAIGEEKRPTGWLLDFKTQYSAHDFIHQTILFKSSQKLFSHSTHNKAYRGAEGYDFR